MSKRRLRRAINRPKRVWWAMAERERRQYRGAFYRWAAAFHRGQRDAQGVKE